MKTSNGVIRQTTLKINFLDKYQSINRQYKLKNIATAYSSFFFYICTKKNLTRSQQALLSAIARQLNIFIYCCNFVLTFDLEKALENLLE